MPAPVLVTGIASAVAAAAMYARKKRAKFKSDNTRLIERLDAIAVKNATVASDLRLVPLSDKAESRSRQN